MFRTRFAPSATGYLHIGGVRTAFFNWLLARQHGGQFLLRIDDTDQQRNMEAALQPILDGFRWLGIDWDEGPQVGGPYEPYFQSKRHARYQAAVDELLHSGTAYRDFATTEEIQSERDSARQDKRPFVYSRQWMAQSDAQAAQFESEGRQCTVRLKMPREGVCKFTDLVRGPVDFAWEREQDHVIQRTNGSVLYHLASVVDDRQMEITHVVRAEEHLSNTPRQMFIAQSLGYPFPEFAHLPYVAEPGGKAKISKRKLEKYLKNPDFRKLNDHGGEIARKIGLDITADTFNPVIVDFYQQVGYLPDALLNYFLLLGWSLDDKTEQFSREDMTRLFSLDRVIKSPASFDPQKLLAFQDRYMRAVPTKRKVALVLPYLQRAGLVSSPPSCDVGPKLARIVDAAGDRIKVAGDVLDFTEFFVPDDQVPLDEKAFEKRIKKDSAAPGRLAALKELLASVDPFEATMLEQTLHEFVASQQIKIGQIIHALRVAVTGKPVGLGMFDSLEILGRESSLARIDRVLRKIEGL